MGGFRVCALNRNTQLAIAHVQGCQQTRNYSLRVLGLPIPNAHPFHILCKYSADGWCIT